MSDLGLFQLRVQVELNVPLKRPRDRAPLLRVFGRLGKARLIYLGTFPLTSRRMRVILKPSPAFSMVQDALVLMRVAGVPFFSSPAERAMLRQAACAAAISSSGLVPLAPSKRVGKE